MHANAALLHRLFTGLNQHQPDTMASCYADDATFEDIAFRLRNKQEIRDMWRMICLGGSGITATFEILHVDDRTARVRLIDRYTLNNDKPPEKRRPVVNVIDSQFVFRNEHIVEHRDDCDPQEWADQAIGGVIGTIAGRVPFVRRLIAHLKLKKFLRTHP